MPDAAGAKAGADQAGVVQWCDGGVVSREHLFRPLMDRTGIDERPRNNSSVESRISSVYVPFVVPGRIRVSGRQIKPYFKVL